MIKLVILRHGESTWNKKNLWTGWTDVNLSERGHKEAKKAAKILKKKGYTFDAIFTNPQKRTLQTIAPIIKELKLTKVTVHKTWRLNERCYGALQGMNKEKMMKQFGEKQFMLWRRSYRVRPPALTRTDKRYKAMLKTYKNVDKKSIPFTESLKDTHKRVVACWKEEIAPLLKKGERVLIAGGGNSMRSLIKHLDNIPEKDIPHVNIPTGIPLVYELNKNLKPIRHYYLGNPKEVKKAIKEVASQGKARK